MEDLEKKRESQRLYRQKHREERIEYVRRYRVANAEELHEKQRIYRLTHREQDRERARLYWQANRERLREKNKQYRAANLEKLRKRDQHRAREGSKYHTDIKRLFGLTKHEYAALLTKQKGVCAICKQSDKRRLAVDHDHGDKLVRGLLCNSCNRGIGFFKDSPLLIEAALKYVRGFSQLRLVKKAAT